jgi:monofunctional biosynthetic peptidoglycan transglycosylase
VKFFLRKLKLVVIFAVLALCAYQLWIFSTLVYWIQINPKQTSFMALRLDALQEKNPEAKLSYQWVPYARISNHLKRAVVASEDDKFMLHNGFDWSGMQQALEKNKRKGRSVAGGSTITQQLAKNFIFITIPFLYSQNTGGGDYGND